MENLERLKNTTILVTGGTGFIGSHLVKELIKLDVRILVPYIKIEEKSFFSTEKLSEKVTAREVDILDKKGLSEFISQNHIDFIVHLAAQTLVTDAYKDPSHTLETNIMGTVNILETVRHNEVKSVIVASSDKAYGKTKKAYSEDSPLVGDHPYDVSKSSADLISQTYFKTYGTPVIITRFGNVYGEGDLHFDRIIPGICKSLILDEELEIRSDGTFIRDYLYVKDVVNGYMHLLVNNNKFAGEAFNFSSSDTLSVLKLIESIEGISGKKVKYRIKNSARNEIPYQHLDDSKVSTTGWQAEYSLEKTFMGVFEWYKKMFKNNI